MNSISVKQVTDEEKELQWKMPQIWDDLVYKSKNTDAGLFTVKKKFTEVSNLTYLVGTIKICHNIDPVAHTGAFCCFIQFC